MSIRYIVGKHRWDSWMMEGICKNCGKSHGRNTWYNKEIPWLKFGSKQCVDEYWKENYFCSQCSNVFRYSVKIPYKIHLMPKRRNAVLCSIKCRDEFSSRNQFWIKSAEAQEKYKRLSRRIPKEVKDHVFDRDKGKCVECGTDHMIEFDHIIPVAKGGSNTEKNIQLLCKTCNIRKRDHIGN